MTSYVMHTLSDAPVRRSGSPLGAELTSRVLSFVSERYVPRDEYMPQQGVTQDDVAHALFDGDYHTTLSYLDDLTESHQVRRITQFGVYQWIPRDQHQIQQTAGTGAHQAMVLVYVTEEFQQGMAGNRRRLPSTRDVARLLSRRGKPQYPLAQAVLDSLLQSSQIIRVADEDETRPSHTYWALDMPGTRCDVVAVDVIW